MVRDTIYELLELNRNAPAEKVKKAFWKFAKFNHPDFFPGDKIKENKFKRVTSAYQDWKLIQTTLNQMKRIQRVSVTDSTEFQPWQFNYAAKQYKQSSN